MASDEFITLGHSFDRPAEEEQPDSRPRSNLEALILGAKAGEYFRERVLEDPVAAAELVDLTLTEGEKQILRAVPKEHLEMIVDMEFDSFQDEFLDPEFLSAGGARPDSPPDEEALE